MNEFYSLLILLSFAAFCHVAYIESIWSLLFIVSIYLIYIFPTCCTCLYFMTVSIRLVRYQCMQWWWMCMLVCLVVWTGVIVIGPEETIVEQFKPKMRLFIFSLGKACSIISLYSNLIIRYLEKWLVTSIPQCLTGNRVGCVWLRWPILT